MDKLPEDARLEFQAILEEGKLVARISLPAALEGVDVAVRPMTSTIIMDRCSWLQSSGLPQDVQLTIQDLPFEGLTLFSQQTDKKQPSNLRLKC